MSNPTKKALKPLEQALAELLAQARPLAGSDSVNTLDADGRVLLKDAISPLQVPPQDNSAMDGYALRCADAAQPGALLPVTQRIPAGSVGQPLQPGTAARIFTGAPVPPGADAVVMQEDCQALPGPQGDPQADPPWGSVRVQQPPVLGQNIRRAGEDIRLGASVLAAGTRLTPAALGLAASIGLAQLPVARRPRVALFSTGDELVMPGQIAPEQMPPGAIYNSNRFFLRALLQRLGCEVSDLGLVPDRLEATVSALRQAASGHDLIVTSGGVSVGEEDHVKPAVQSLGRLDLWAIAIKPGKPFAYGQVWAEGQAGQAQQPAGGVHFIGLPGNPVSSLITFALLVRPFVLRLQGVADVAPRCIKARAAFAWGKVDQRREFLRVKLNAQGELELFRNQSSGVLTSTVWGDGLVDNPPGQLIQPGDEVRFIPFTELL